MREETTPNTDRLPGWVPVLAVLAVLVLIGSGLGIRLLTQSMEAGAQATQAAQARPTVTPTAPSDAPTRTPVPPTPHGVYQAPLIPPDIRRITAPDEVQRHPLRLREGDILVIEGGAVPGSAAQAEVRLRHPDGPLLLWALLGYSRLVIPEDGLYTVEVAARDALHLGAYTLTAHLVGPDEVPRWQQGDETAWQTETAGGIPSPGSGAGQVSPPQREAWRLLVEGGRTYRITTQPRVTVAVSGQEGDRERAYPVTRAVLESGEVGYTFTAPTNGVARVFIMPRGGATAYTFDVRSVERGEAFVSQRGPFPTQPHSPALNARFSLRLSAIGEPLGNEEGENVLRFVANSQVASLVVSHAEPGIHPPTPYTLTFDEGPGFDLAATRTLGERTGEGRLRLPHEAERWLLALDAGERVVIGLPSSVYDIVVTDAADGLVAVRPEGGKGLPPGRGSGSGVYSFQAGQGGLYAVYVYRIDGGGGLYTISADVLPGE